jgi:hypothetical protein
VLKTYPLGPSAVTCCAVTAGCSGPGSMPVALILSIDERQGQLRTALCPLPLQQFVQQAASALPVARPRSPPPAGVASSVSLSCPTGQGPVSLPRRKQDWVADRTRPCLVRQDEDPFAHSASVDSLLVARGFAKHTTRCRIAVRKKPAMLGLDSARVSHRRCYTARIPCNH